VVGIVAVAAAGGSVEDSAGVGEGATAVGEGAAAVGEGTSGVAVGTWVAVAAGASRIGVGVGRVAGRAKAWQPLNTTGIKRIPTTQIHRDRFGWYFKTDTP
jgi:hypothetical protein